MGKLSLERPKGGRGRLIELAAWFPILLHNYFRTLISSREIEGVRFIGGHLMDIQVYTLLIAIQFHKNLSLFHDSLTIFLGEML